MIRKALAGTLMLALALVSNIAFAQTSTPKDVIVDVSKPLPSSVNLVIGQRVQFVHPTNWNGSAKLNFTYGPAGKIGRTVSPLKYDKGATAAAGSTAVATLKAYFPGSGTFDVTFATTGNLNVTSTKSVKFAVNLVGVPSNPAPTVNPTPPAPPAPPANPEPRPFKPLTGSLNAKTVAPSPAKKVKPGVVIDMTKPLPKSLTLEEGQSVVFENGFAKIEAKETDGKGALLEKRPHNTFNQIAAFRAKRAGKGEFTIIYTVQTPGHKPMKPTSFKVEVTPAP